MALDHHAIRRTDLMRIDHEGVTHRDVRQRHIQHFRRPFPVGDRRHPFGQRGQHRRGAAQRVALQRLTSGEHQDDDRAGQVLAQQDGRHDGNAAQQIGAEFPLQELPKQVIEKRQAAESERGQQGNLVSARSGVEAEAKRPDAKGWRDGKRRDDRGLAVPETGRRVPGPAGRDLLTPAWLRPHLRAAGRCQARARRPVTRPIRTRNTIRVRCSCAASGTEAGSHHTGWR